MTLSPALSPSSTTQLLPCVRPTLSGRISTLFSALTTYVVGLPLASRKRARCGNKMADRPRFVQDGAHVHARKQFLLGVREDGPQGHHAGALVHAHVGELERAGKPVLAAVFKQQAHRRVILIGALERAVLKGTLERRTSVLDWVTST